VENDGDYACVIEALDSDQDGYRSALCEVNPGDDCDDDAAWVHPDAEEVCDGIDNDCSSTLDLEDGLELGGSSNTLSEIATLDVGWSPTLERFGVAHVTRVMTENLTQRSLFLGTIAAGTDYEQVGLVAELAGAPGSTLRVSWGDNHWALWENSGPMGADSIQAHHVDAEGNLLYQTAGGITEGLDAAYRELGDWLVVSGDASLLRLINLASDDPEARLVESDVLDTKALFPRIAALGNAGAVVWQANSGAIEWALVSQDHEFGEPEELATSGQRPRIAALRDGYALTWATETGFSYETRTPDGDALCGPVSVDFGDGVLDDTDTAAVAATELGVVVVALDRADAHVELFRFDRDCELSAQALVFEGPAGPTSVNVASGGNQVAVSWTTKSEAGVAGHVRSFGALLCD
jgi:hypothetical protein